MRKPIFEGRQAQFEIVLQTDEEQLNDRKICKYQPSFNQKLNGIAAKILPGVGDPNNHLNDQHRTDDQFRCDVEYDDYVVSSVVQLDQLFCPSDYYQQQRYQVDYYDEDPHK